jgi:hypothetical protein
MRAADLPRSSKHRLHALQDKQCLSRFVGVPANAIHSTSIRNNWRDF